MAVDDLIEKINEMTIFDIGLGIALDFIGVTVAVVDRRDVQSLISTHSLAD